MSKLRVCPPNRNILVFKKQPRTTPFAVTYCSQHTESKTHLSEYEHKENVSSFRSLWRKPFNEREGFWKTKLDLFSNKLFPASFTRFNPDNFKFLSFKQWWDYRAKESIVFNQQFIKERLDILGPDLAAAHFVVYRKGAVKFYNLPNWIKDDKIKREYDEDLPNVFHPEYIIEAIDFSKTKILYEGMKNIEGLDKLKWLSFKDCYFFDDWCLDRLSGEHGDKLEYLDIRNTPVTCRGLSALYKFKKLKTLKVYDMYDDPQFSLLCIEIDKYFPCLTIEGISPNELVEYNQGTDQI